MLFARRIGKNGVPLQPTESGLQVLRAQTELDYANATTEVDLENLSRKLEYFQRLGAGEVFFDTFLNTVLTKDVKLPQIANVHASQCYSCEQIAVWAGDRLVFPSGHVEVEPNADLPDDIRADYKEAAFIFGPSPRGAAPSEAFVRWTRGELMRHANWIQAQLDDIHLQFVKRLNARPSILAAIGQLPAAWSTLAARARHKNRHDLVADPNPVLRFGMAQRIFCVSPDQYRSESRSLYRLPSATELNKIHHWLRSIPNILGSVWLDARQLATADKVAVLQATDWPVLRALIAAHLHVPQELVGADLLPSFQVFLSEQFEAHIYAPRFPYHPPAAGSALLRLVNKDRRIALPNWSRMHYFDRRMRSTETYSTYASA